jgi:hypothetical protein
MKQMPRGCWDDRLLSITARNLRDPHRQQTEVSSCLIGVDSVEEILNDSENGISR